MREERPVADTIAAIACVLNSLSNLGTLVAPIPRPVVYASVAAAVRGLAGAYGVWQLKRWGAALSVVILAVTALLAAPGIPFAPNLALHVFASATVILDLVAISLLVVPFSRRSYA
jgi:uncharacterized membrane protein (DUF2068 family)